MKGTGNQQDYGMRISDPRIGGRFLSVDPLTKGYPELTPYQFAGNTPIQAIDLDGEEPEYSMDSENERLKRQGEAVLKQLDERNTVPRFQYSQATLSEARAPKNEFERQRWESAQKREFEKVGRNPDGTQKPITQLLNNKTYKSFSENLAMPLIEGYTTISGGTGLIKGGLSLLKNSSTVGAVGLRYMSLGELKAIQKTDLLRGGIDGETFFTKDLYRSATKAQQRLALPNLPEYRVEFEILNNPTFLRNGTKVQPNFRMPGKGSEFMTTDPVKVNLINFQPLKK